MKDMLESSRFLYGIEDDIIIIVVEETVDES